jgi:DNA-binding transcriptional MerR regulator
MTTSYDTPAFNLKAVVQQTGLKPDTLRAWERRYGLPQPQRSAGGHRLYSERDIGTVKWLMARQVEGLSIKRAVEMWRRLEAEGQDPLLAPAPAAPVPATAGSTVTQLREAWIDACLAFDEQRAENILSQAFAFYPPEAVCLELLQKGVAQVGQKWYQGEATVQQEHFTSGLAMRRIEALVMACPPPTRPGRILAACPPDEEHAFGLLLLTFLLRRQGWKVVYLGANVPLGRMKATVDATRPQVVILAAQQLRTAATLLEMAQLLQGEFMPVAFGGLIFNRLPPLRTRIPGHFLGESLDRAPSVVEHIMATPRPRPSPEANPDTYHRARDHYRELEPLIEVYLGQALKPRGIAREHLFTANQALANNVMAALTLGDLGLLDADMEWIKGLLSNYDLPVELADDYLTAYHQAAAAHLGERGAPILDWLAQRIDT